MKFLKTRVLPLFLVFVLSVSMLVVPASASGTFPDDLYDDYSVGDWNAQMNAGSSITLSAIASYFGINADPRDVFWHLVDGRIGQCYGEVGLGELEALAESFNQAFNTPAHEYFLLQAVDGVATIYKDTFAQCTIGTLSPNFKVTFDVARNVYRIIETNTSIYVVDSAGRYPYVEDDGEYIGTDQWLPISVMDGGIYRMLSKESIYNLADDVGGTVYTRGNYLCITKAASSPLVDKMVLANEDGKPYVCWKDKNQSATEQDRPTDKITENGDIVEGDLIDNSVNLDLEGMTMLLPGGTLAFIDQIIYDESTKSYHIDSHDTYNYTVNNYYTWNYYINYTSITYIGQTEEYNKYYEVYYELPDGRSSADLTKEDLEQLNLSVDVIPYGRSADDTSLRSLYHFDGDTKDSSYWNYCTDFTWNKGASLTYMDAGVFEGALYLDETEHDFTIKLPSNIGSSDFTIQFRYYQSATAAPVSDSFIYLGGEALWSCDGASYKSGGGTSTFATMPVGSWNEIAFIRKDGQFAWYLNGVYLHTSTVQGAKVFGDTITFEFGSGQQTFKYLDELRVLHYAIADIGKNYEPTSVPHDTNLTLVLPDSKLPVADEYWSIKNDVQTNILSQYNMDSFYGSANATNSRFLNIDTELSSSALTSSSGLSKIGYFVEGGNDLGTYQVNPSFPSFAYYGKYTDVSFLDDGIHMDSSSWSPTIPLDKMLHYKAGRTNALLTASYFYSVVPSSGLYSVLTFDNGKSQTNNLPAGDYTFTLVTSSGDMESVTFTVPNTFDKTYWHTNTSDIVEAYNHSGPVSMATVGGYEFGLYKTYATVTGTSMPSYHWLVVRPVDRDTATEGIVYMELVSGRETALEAEFVESVTAIDKDDLNTPTLAVRTDIDITSYQIGGVRPSIPEKGQVWAMVENDRIVSIQIYNGQAWEGVDGRIWTGQRWIPASSYNIITLQDMYDIVDATPNYEYIYSEAGFWAWWQKSWNAFTEKLFLTLGSGGAGGGASGGAGSSELNKVDLDSAPVVSDPDEEDGKSLWQFIILVVDGGKSVVTGTRELFSGVVSTIPDTMDGITGAFDSGGIAVGIFDGSDPDAEDIESEVLDPWRYQ